MDLPSLFNQKMITTVSEYLTLSSGYQSVAGVTESVSHVGVGTQTWA